MRRVCLNRQIVRTPWLEPEDSFVWVVAPHASGGVQLLLLRRLQPVVGAPLVIGSWLDGRAGRADHASRCYSRGRGRVWHGGHDQIADIDAVERERLLP